MSEEVSEKVTIVDSLEEEKEELRSRVYQKTEEQFSREQELIKKVNGQLGPNQNLKKIYICIYLCIKKVRK